MKKFVFIFFIGLLSANGIAQNKQSLRSIDRKDRMNLRSNDSISDKEITVKLSGKTQYTDYKIISFTKDTTYIDTTLTLTKEYKFNFLRKDNFEIQAFQNQGGTFNRLGYDFAQLKANPEIGMTGKMYNYLAVEAISYYQVPTPTSEILYRTGMEQGQVLESLFTLNFSKRFNVGILYKGLRSLGKYRNSLASHGNFRTVFSYNTKNERYYIRGHIAMQDLSNQENGGLTPDALIDFTSNNPNFKERGRLDVNLESAETLFESERFYLEQEYKLFTSKDSTNTHNFSNLKIGHIIRHELQSYQFTQQTSSAFLGTTSAVNPIDDRLEYRLINNQFSLEFNSKYILGKLKALVDYSNYNYGYAAILNSNNPISNPTLKGTDVSFGASWDAKIKNFQLHAKTQVSPGTSQFSGNNFYSEAIYKKDSIYSLKASLGINSKYPNFNTLLFQSSYDAYNWQNDAFKKVNTQNLSFGIDTKWIAAEANFTTIENYTYFDATASPQQSANTISYLKIKANNEIPFGKFALNNTLLFQQVSSGSSVFRVPDFVTRNTLYYTDYWFKGKPMKVQIGATFKYFTKYKMNAFNPLLNEFTIQNAEEIGYPTVDVFFNAQVRRTRLYFKIENVTSSFAKKNYFSAPNYPYRDFVIRFGLVWNWFI